jgi:hypothetical protein
VATKDAIDNLAMVHYDLPYPPDHYYMPIARRQSIIDTDIDRHPIIDPDKVFDFPAICAFIETLRPYAEERAAIPDYWEIHSLGLGLGFGEIEGHIYYSLVRDRAPDILVEIGSGVSTHYANLARKKNATPTRLICFEPYPSDAFRAYCVAEGIELITEMIQTYDLAPLLGELTARSMVFVDSTHVVRSDGELVKVFLQILPALPSGALVHFHDIFLPFAVNFREHEHSHASFVWNESLCLAIFLAMNQAYEAVLPAFWMGRVHQDVMVANFAVLERTNQCGSSFWMRRR